ncbi:amidohydrolase [Bremerella cremea]|uniref:Amidohydrolase n=1 Tax=Bremerella cremea TaxID=1031537 RepID=A0A368KPX9_9BACT|nr:amidohydrolase [Bremerella cremea]RCS47723.1 amidohydrolase [Bremerella cremea]
MTAWQSRLCAQIDQINDSLIEFRRSLHRNPEVSGEEFQTSLTLYQILGDLGLSVRMGPDGRGVIADLDTFDQEGSSVIALRGDIDALPIHDCKDVPYCSQKEGIMHACGHDAHTTVVLGAAQALQQLARNGELPWPIRARFIFQPAEEICTGARDMIKAGALEDVSAIIATHMEPGLPFGKVGFRKGELTASCEEIWIKIHGSSGHGARPYEANDPIAAAAQLINTLYLALPRVTQTHEAVVASFGQIHGGASPNVIPETVELQGTLRTLLPQTRLDTIRHIHRIADGIAMATQTQIEVKFDLGTDAVRNDSNLIDLLKENCVEFMGMPSVHEIPRASMGGEDFAFYLDHVPGAMIRLGCATPGTSNWPMLHSTNFDIDERVLAFGANLLARSTVAALEPGSRWQDQLLTPRSPTHHDSPLD